MGDILCFKMQPVPSQGINTIFAEKDTFGCSSLHMNLKIIMLRSRSIYDWVTVHCKAELPQGIYITLD